MTLYAMKPQFQTRLRPMTALFAETGVTANQVTLWAALGSLAVGAVVAGGAGTHVVFLLLPIWLFVRMGLNAIDGMLAREFGQKSVIGAYLNEIGDLVSDAALALPFAMLPVFGPLWVGLVVVLIMIAEFAGVMGPMIGATRRYDGPLGKSDRALVFGVLGLWIGLGGGTPRWLGAAMPLIAMVLVMTIYKRIRAAMAEAASSPSLPAP